MAPNQAGRSPRMLWAVVIGLAAMALQVNPEVPTREPQQANPNDWIQPLLGMKLDDETLRFPGGRRLQVVVREVKPNGPAAKGGVQTGDIVVFVEDQLVSRTQDVVNILKHVASNCPVSFDLLRAGRPVMAAVKPAREELR
jgi:S1-C subfamily serine protease